MRTVLAAASLCVTVACATVPAETRDARLDADDGEAVLALRPVPACGPNVAGNIVVLDARTGGPLTCQSIEVVSEPMSCAAGAECPSEAVFNGFTNSRGQFSARGPMSGVRLVALADGYARSYLQNASFSPRDRVELEIAPLTQFWLKVLDDEGTYVPELWLTFRQAGEPIAHLKSNVLANVFFSSLQPFSGEPVTVEADGYLTQIVTRFGDDGHTLTLKR